MGSFELLGWPLHSDFRRPSVYREYCRSLCLEPEQKDSKSPFASTRYQDQRPSLRKGHQGRLIRVEVHRVGEIEETHLIPIRPEGLLHECRVQTEDRVIAPHPDHVCTGRPHDSRWIEKTPNPRAAEKETDGYQRHLPCAPPHGIAAVAADVRPIAAFSCCLNSIISGNHSPFSRVSMSRPFNALISAHVMVPVPMDSACQDS